MSHLPEPVLQAMQRGDHDQAIRMLTVNQGLSPEEAQEQLNIYLEENPPVRLRGAGIVGLSRTNALIWLGLIVLMGVVYLVLAS
ncbi:hypothetical protein ACX0MV_11985 [Pseudomonas borbori]